MPSSVLLAILVGAGVLALMPALIRRYDAAARGQLERTSTSMRLLNRNMRRRHRAGSTTSHSGHEGAHAAVPMITARASAHEPIHQATDGAHVPADSASHNGSTFASDALGSSRRAFGYAENTRVPLRNGPELERNSEGMNSASRSRPQGGQSSARGRGVAGPERARRPLAIRRRSILAVLFVLLVMCAIGALAISPWLWISAVVSCALLLGYLVAIRASVRRELARRRSEWAQVRREATRRRAEAQAFVAAVEQIAYLDAASAALVAGWLAREPASRLTPNVLIRRVLAVVHREPFSIDGAWFVRRATASGHATQPAGSSQFSPLRTHTDAPASAPLTVRPGSSRGEELRRVANF